MEDCLWEVDPKEDKKENGHRLHRGHSEHLYERSQLPELLRVYYMWLFPYDKYHEWLQYGERKNAF